MTIPSLIALVDFLAAKGANIDFYHVYNNYFPRDLYHFQQPNVQMYSFRVEDGQSIYGRGAPLPVLFVLKHWKHFKRKKYDAVIAADAAGLVAAALAQPSLRAPMIYLSLEIYTWDDLHSPQAKALKLLERWAHAWVALTIVQDETRLGLLFASNGLRPDPAKVCLIPNSPLGEARIQRSSFFREKFGIPPEHTIILHAGALGGYTLSRELADAVSQWPDDWVLIFHVKRDESDEKYYAVQEILQHENYKNGRIKLSLNPVPFDKVDLVYSSADIGLVLYDPFMPNVETIGLSSGKLAHYLQCGVPVIASNLASLRSLIEKYHCGACINHVTQIKDKIDDLLNNYSYYQSRAINLFNDNYKIYRYLDNLFIHINNLYNKT